MQPTAQPARLILGLLAFLLLAPVATSAQSGTGNVEVVVETTDPAEFPAVSVHVTVLDPDGMPISSLDASNFDLFEDGKQVPVLRVEPYVNPEVKIAVALAIDISGSMYEEIGAAKQAAIKFVNDLAPADLAAVLAFRGNPGDVNLGEPFPQLTPDFELDFTDDKTAVVTLIDRLAVPSTLAGRTPLYDTLFKAARMTSRVSGADYRFVMAFTDGRETCNGCPGSILKPEDPIDEAQKHNVPIFTIGLGGDADVAYLQRVALTTGGSYQFTPTPDKLAQIYQGVADRLKSQYVVTYRAKAAADGREHKLDIKVTTPSGEGNNVLPIAYPCPEKPGIRLFYEKPSQIMGEEATVELLEDNQEVVANFTVVPDISACNPISKVELFIDDTLAFTADNRPFHLLYDYYRLQQQSPGLHKLSVRAYDDAGNVSDDAVVTVNVPAIVLPSPDAPTPGPGAAAIGATPTVPPGSIALNGWSVRRWVLGVVSVAFVILLLTLVLLLTRLKRKNTCPNCGRVMDPEWSTCKFCANQGRSVEDTTVPEQPVLRPGHLDSTVPDIPSYPQPRPVPQFQDGLPVASAGPAPMLDPTAVMKREPQRMAWLIVERGDRVGKEFRLQARDTSLGRAGTNDIVLNDPAASRQQARIKLEGDGYYLHDLAATNPTQVNGQDVHRHRLTPGDRVQIGNTVLVFKEIQTRD